MSDDMPIDPTNTGSTLTPAQMMERMLRVEAELVALRAERATLVPPVTPTVTSTDELLARIASSITSGGSRNRINTIDKPKPFDGAMGEPIHDFITTYEAYFRSLALNQDRELADLLKIDAVLHRTSPTVKKALLREQKEQQWQTWKSFKDYLITTYGTTDSPLERYRQLLEIHQRNNETVAEYTVRFRDELEKQAYHLPPEAAWRDHLLYLKGLSGKMQGQMPTFPEYKGIEQKSFAQVVEFAKRVEESIRASNAASSSRQAKQTAGRIDSGTQGSSSAESKRGPGGKFLKPRGKNGVEHQSPYDTAALTPHESKIVEASIQRGGGILLRESIQKKRVWLNRAFKEGRCIKCAAVGHRADKCTVVASKKKEEEINALVAEMENHHIDSGMEEDAEYLFSIAHSASPLAMYECSSTRQGELHSVTSELPECMSLGSSLRNPT
jgi:hypothetical protein